MIIPLHKYIKTIIVYTLKFQSKMGPKAQRKSPSRSKSPKKGGGEAKEDTAFINATLSDVCLF